jgi:hypothetical protein
VRIHSLIIAALLCVFQLRAVSAGDLVTRSEPVIRGTIRSVPSDGDKCLTAPETKLPQGARLEMRPCRNGANQIFEWNALSFDIKMFDLCVDVLRGGESNTQPGDPVGLWYCQGTLRQRWFPIHNNLYVRAVSIVGGDNPNGDLCLQIRDGSNADGAEIEVSICNDEETQQFRIQPWPVLSNKVSPRPLGQVQ